MTTSHDQPMSRLLAFLTHSIPCMIVASIILRALYLLGWNGWTAGDLLLSLGVLLGIIAMAFHREHMCLRCIRSSPLNPQRSVDRNAFFLWWSHLPFKTFMFVWLSGLAVSLIPTASHLGMVLTKLPMDVIFYVVMWSTWIHHKLTPWCPYCRGWDEGGEEELIPDPDPAETKTA